MRRELVLLRVILVPRHIEQDLFGVPRTDMHDGDVVLRVMQVTGCDRNSQWFAAIPDINRVERADGVIIPGYDLRPLADPVIPLRQIAPCRNLLIGRVLDAKKRVAPRIVGTNALYRWGE